MTRLKNILIQIRQIAYTLYTFVVFVLLMMVLVQPLIFLYFLFGKKTEQKRLRYHQAIQWLARCSTRHVPGISFSFRNVGGETFERPSMIISNHQSHFDLMCVLMLSPKIVVLTNDWVWRNPLYGLLIRYAEYYPVSDGLETNLERLRGLVSRGYSVMVFPEGTRSADGKIHRFHKGPFYLAEKLGLDIVPMFIHGGTEVLNKKAWTLSTGEIYVQVNQRIASDDERYGSDYRERVKGMRRYYEEEYALICRERKQQKGGGDGQ